MRRVDQQFDAQHLSVGNRRLIAEAAKSQEFHQVHHDVGSQRIGPEFEQGKQSGQVVTDCRDGLFESKPRSCVDSSLGPKLDGSVEVRDLPLQDRAEGYE
jgi:hypothetical protein